jgi:biopolymer transport protein ExbB/TolQ
MPRNSSSVGTALGILVAVVAVVGSQFLGWEWGGGQLLPTVIGVAVAVVAVVLVGQRVLA